jgi:hypothetical protein
LSSDGHNRGLIETLVSRRRRPILNGVEDQFTSVSTEEGRAGTRRHRLVAGDLDPQ